MSNDDGQLEDRKDFSADVEKALPESTALAKSDLSSAVDLLMALEKKCRVGNDIASLKKVCEHAVKVCAEVGDWDKMVHTLNFVAKRRSQKNGAIGEAVKEGMAWIEKCPESNDKKKKLVVCLREITDGRIFVEAERARLTKQLADMLEGEGNIVEAADVIQEVHVETFGSLSKLEKVEFILEQVRLVLAKKDWIRAYIVSQKISKKVLEEAKFAQLKIRYHRLMLEYYRHEKNCFELAKAYHQIYKTQKGSEENTTVEVWGESLKSFVYFLILSKHSNEQQDLLHRSLTTEKESLLQIPEFHACLNLFTTNEIIPFPFLNQGTLEDLPARTENGEELAAHFATTLHQRVVQYNIRVAASCYTRVTGTRLAQLLSLEGGVLERELSAMVSDGDLYARINRPSDIVCFEKSKSHEERLSEVGSDLDKLLSLCNDTTHLIAKEMAR